MTPTSPMHQVPLPLVPQGEYRFDNFLPGPNGLVLGLLTAELPPGAPVFLWGDAGSGKTHLLQALAAACRQRGLAVGLWDAGSPLPWVFDPGCSLLVFDDVHRLSADQQQAAFGLCVEAQAQGIQWAAAAPMPPVDLPLRDDLRSRLGWGQVHALRPLDEEQTRLALGAEAERRGIVLSPDVMNYLMSRLSRDLSSLMQLLEQLDGFSLSRGRAVTVPLLRTMLAESSVASAAESQPLSGSLA
jgi:DnaA-homolog protein